MLENSLNSETFQIPAWQAGCREPVRFLLKAGIGMSFALATICPTDPAPNQKNHRVHAVDQPKCHSEHRNDRLTRPASSVRQCKGCGQPQEQSEFASKGRDRTSALCKSCDNKRRRSTYRPKLVAPDWDQVTIRYEVEEANAESTAPLIWELLIEQRPWAGSEVRKEESLDSLLNRRSAIDGIITEA